MQIFQKGVNLSQDGPGNRLVYHIAGCNMRCLWCSNPEGMQESNTHTTYSKDTLVAEAISCKPLFFDGGGVTFTGGEATLHAEELMEVLQALKEAGIHTAIETNGTSPKLMEILAYVDYLMMDFKHYDDAILKKFTGLEGSIIKENYAAITQSGRQCHIRIPLINGFNADHAQGFAEFLSKFPTDNIVFEFLKYHEFGKEKWQSAYQITDGFVNEEQLAAFQQAFDKHGLIYIET